MLNQILGQTNSHLVQLDSGFWLHKDVVNDFEQLTLAAQQAGFDLAIASSFRDFDRQLTIWNNKYQGKRPCFDKNNNQVNLENFNDWQKVQAILVFSAIPGLSRHHWGTDIDIYDKRAVDENYTLALSPDEYTNSGPFVPLVNWLNENAHKWGFYFPYNKDRSGIAQEPWHLSHYSTAKRFQTELNAQLPEVKQKLLTSDILGKASIAEHLSTIMHQYINNIEVQPK